MAYTTVNKSSLHQNTVLYTGNNTGQSITGVGFQPDLVWNKSRGNTESHNVWDAVRGTTKGLVTNTGDAESTWATGLTSFDSDGWTMGELDSMNDGSVNFAAWCWKANGAGSSNTDGTINTTSTSVNTTAGFSISTYTGTGANATVGHGLGVAPKMIIIKGRSNAHWWFVYHAGIPTPTTAKLNLNTNGYNNDAQASYWNSTAPTSSVFSLGTESSVNNSGSTYVAYCFADVTGYSKMGSYVGNGYTDGAFIYTGFKPKFLLLKRDNGSNSWEIRDDKRSYNLNGDTLWADAGDAGSVGEGIDFLSNGFKCRASGAGQNGSGNTYIYMAFGQSLVGSNNVPNTAF